MEAADYPLVAFRLEQQSLFSFGTDARQLAFGVNEMALQIAALGDVLSSMVYLSAAEFSVGDRIAAAEHLLPVREPHTVNDRHMRLAMLKTDCSIDFNCFARLRASGRLGPLETMVFGADALKVNPNAWGAATVDPEARFEVVESLVTRHLESPLAEARLLGQRGGMQLQGLLWHLKLAVASGEDLDDSIRSYVARFGLGSSETHRDLPAEPA